VLWTLEIEMVFYLIMGIACLIDFRMDFTRLLCISFVCGCTALLYFWLRNSYRGGHDWPNFRHISGMLVHVAYMLIGSLIYRAHCAERIAVALASIFAGVSLFVAAYGIYGLATDNMPIGTNLPSCATALLIFLAAMWSGMRSKYFFPLRWIASISYPLYLIHVPLAWAILYWMASFGAGMNVAAFTGAVIAIICAWCIHHAAELPLQKMGKAFSGHIGGG
jgi:peptidoglycan/LPS O-acetylase OafA/YrhL